MRFSAATFRDWGVRAFGCDLRSLAALRIALGLLLLAGLALRLPEFHAHYTDAGAWPIAAARQDAPRAWSLYFLHGSAMSAAILFAISALAAVALVAGWFTRTATIVSWVLLLSLQARNELMLNGGDVVLRLLLFWGALLPLGARWSMDARGRAETRGVVVSGATVGLLLQVALIYVFNALYKTSPAWHAGATAVEDALRLETYATPAGRWLLGYPAALQAGTRAVWWLELLGPALILIPWRTGAFRFAAFVLFAGFHLGLYATLRIGLFPLICVAAWLPVLPSSFWDFFRRRTADEPVVLRQPVAVHAAAAVAFAAVLVWNIGGMHGTKFAPWFRNSVHAVRLEQKWQLFAPPHITEGWHVAVLECADGEEYDALTGDIIDWRRPASLANGVRSVNWRKFLAGLRAGYKPERLRWLAIWLVREWEAAHPDRKVQRVRLHYLWEWTAKRQSPPDNALLYEDPPGKISAMLEKRKLKPIEPAESGDN